jgi:cell wall-associated NlpC family hydrolase
MSGRKSLALASLVAVLTLTVSTAALAAPPNPTGKGIATASGSAKPARAKDAAKISAKAERLLKRLLKAAAAVSADDEQVAVLSERYDVYRYKLSKVSLEVTTLGVKVRRDDGQLLAAAYRLRKAAVVAYVSGELGEANANVLLDNESEGQMAQVYAGIALGELSQALGRYQEASKLAHSSRTSALASSRRLAATLAGIAALRAKARSLTHRATDGYDAVSRRLRHLVGAKEFARIFFSVPVGTPYKGADLAGTHVAKLATSAEGQKAALAAEKFLGVPYVFGGAGKAGVDCSGLTMLAWAAAGVSLVHSATLQWEQSKPVALDQLRPGDLLFFHFANDGAGAITHVVMYLGSGPFGLETVIQAAEPGTNVAVGKVNFDGFVSAGRP